MLTSLAFKNLVHPFQPFIIGQRIIGPKIASRFGIPLVMYGENQAEYGNKIDENNIPVMDNNFFTVSDPLILKLGGLTIEKIMTDYGYELTDFEPYLPLKISEIQKSDIEVHYLGYYIKWDPQECFYYAVENTGFESNTERTEGSYSKYSSIDDKIDPFHYYTTLIKFGIGRATYDASQEIRNGKITRDEGIALVKNLMKSFQKNTFNDF